MITQEKIKPKTMSQQHYSMFSGTWIKYRGKLIPANNTTKVRYQAFLDSLRDGQSVENFMDANKDDGTLPQLAKIHACIRRITEATGNDAKIVKREIKIRAGLVTVYTNDKGKKVRRYKSFAKCSKEELGLAIDTIINIGDLLSINFR